MQSAASSYFSKTSSLMWKVTVAKVISDIIIFDPPYLATFFMSTGICLFHIYPVSSCLSDLVRGVPYEKAYQHMRHEFGSTYLIDLLVWTPVQLVNFRYVPLNFQPVIYFILITFTYIHILSEST